MLPSNSDKTRKHRKATSDAMKRIAEARRCPSCQRKSAIKTSVMEGFGVTIKVCRWCGWEKSLGEIPTET